MNIRSTWYMTELEQEMAKLIDNIQFHDEAHHQFKTGHWLIDFAIPTAKLAIECEGEHWGADPCYYAFVMRRDHELAKLGWTVLRFTRHDVFDHALRTMALVEVVLRPYRLQVADVSVERWDLI